MAPPSAETFELRGIPGLVWQALAEPVSLDDLVDDLAVVFDQEPVRVRGEIEQLLAELTLAGVVRTA